MTFIPVALVLALISFASSVLLFPTTIRILQKIAPKRIQESLRPQTYALHKKKQGTPSMGGVLFLLVAPLLMFIVNRSPQAFLLMGALWGYGILGLIDDLLSTYGKKNFGFPVARKALLQILIAGIVAWGILSIQPFPYPAVLYGWPATSYIFSFVFIMFTLVATTNAVNFTDGLDGLAGGLLLMSFTFFGVLSFLVGQTTIVYICCITIGWLGAFLVFNKNPAKIFMGDAGSLGLGALLTTISFLLQQPFFILISGGVFVMEAISVVLQLSWKKLFKRKLFALAPLHHHLEAHDWQERSIVKLLWSIGFCINIFLILFLLIIR